MIPLNCTSISSLYFRRGASMIFLNLKVSLPTSRLCPVTAAILCQCLSIMALLAMDSSSGQHSLNSSMIFFRSRNACQSFRARGSFRHLPREAGVRGHSGWAQPSAISTRVLALPPSSPNTYSIFLNFVILPIWWFKTLTYMENFILQEIAPPN